MSTMPKIIDVEFTTILGEEKKGVIIPISIKSRQRITEYSENRKRQIKDSQKFKKDEIKLELEELSEEDLNDMYLRTLFTSRYLDLGKELGDKEFNKEKTRYAEKELADKSKEDLIRLTTNYTMELGHKTELLVEILSITLFEVLRETENKSKNLFNSVEQLLEEVDETVLAELYACYNKDADVDSEDEIKN